MFDNPMNYGPPGEKPQKQVTFGGFLMSIYAVIGIAVGATWPLWVLLMVAL